MRSSPIRSVGLVLVPGFPLMSYSAIVEPLRGANHLSGKPLYRWWHASPASGPALASAGTAVVPDFPFGNDDPELDLAMVCAGGNPAKFNNRATFAWLRRLARRGVIMGGISGGPYILAKAGLLAGHRCTIHWEHAPSFQETFPDISLTRSLFEIDADRITCSGGISALDLMITLITRDHGRELAAAVGDWFLHSHVREGVGPQRMDIRYRFGTVNESILTALKAMEANLETPFARHELAAMAGVSVRQLERSFRRHLGKGIHQHYLGLRLERARQLLRETSLPVMDVAVATGFCSASQFARAFRHHFGAPPSRAARWPSTVTGSGADDTRSGG